MTAGRPPLGAGLVECLAGSSQAKERLGVILRSLAGEITVAQACAELGIGKSRFHEMRNQWLQESLAGLEPRPPGRHGPPHGDPRIADLQQQVDSLKIDLRAAQIREELAISLPHVGRTRPSAEPDKKKRRRRRGRRRR